MTKMNLKWTTALAVTAAVLVVLLRGLESFVPPASAQVPEAAEVEGFEATDYYEEPNHTRLKARLKADKVNPYEGGRLLLTTINLDVFHLDGAMAFTVKAPECIYDFGAGTASSTGRLHMASGDGRLSVEGEGFQWRQREITLNISNRVHTVLRGMVTNKAKQ